MKLKKIKESIDQKVELNEKAAFLQEVAKFNEYGNIIYRTDSLKEAAKAVSKIVENAERIALQETDEWFDDLTVKRNMKSLKSNNEQFMKTVSEVSKLQQRLESLYEEMGHTLSRYYEIK
jgi:ABC-type branched-subunit amino acid transport system ATPase component